MIQEFLFWLFDLDPMFKVFKNVSFKDPTKRKQKEQELHSMLNKIGEENE